LSTASSENSRLYDNRSPDPCTPPPSSGFHNPNYDSSLPNNDETPSDPRNTRRFYYAALSPTDMGVNDPVLFLSPDDQVNNNSTIPQDSRDIPGVEASGEGQFAINEETSSSSALPCGWERHDDTNGPYYWHIKSGTIQRDPPTLQQISAAGGSSNPALLIPGSLQSSSVAAVPFRRSQTVSSQLSSAVHPNNSNTNSSGGTENTPSGTVSTVEKRKSWSQYLENSENHSSRESSMTSSYLHSSSNQNGSKHLKDKPLRFIAVSLGCLCISEEDLTPERSSRAVSKVIAELTNPNSKMGSSAGYVSPFWFEFRVPDLALIDFLII
jgi:amyloid beta (A4) precursor protein-binding family B protein 2 (Fe65-like)